MQAKLWVAWHQMKDGVKSGLLQARHVLEGQSKGNINPRPCCCQHGQKHPQPIAASHMTHIEFSVSTASRTEYAVMHCCAHMAVCSAV